MYILEDLQVVEIGIFLSQVESRLIFNAHQSYGGWCR